MKSYLSMIPISAKAHKRENRMTIWCIIIAVFLVTAVFSMAEMAIRQETERLIDKHGFDEVIALFSSDAFKSLLPIAVVLFAFVLCAGILMIAGSMNSNVARRTQLFGMMRCIGMSKRQVIRYVRLEALNWCKSAIPTGLLAGTVTTWILCAVLKYCVGGEWADMPQLGVSAIGIVSGIVVGVLTVLISAGRPARRAAAVSPVTAVSGAVDAKDAAVGIKSTAGVRIENALGIRHATRSKKNLFLMIGSFALSIILFLSFSVFIDLVDHMMPQSASRADLEIYSGEDEFIDSGVLSQIAIADGVERAFGRRAIFGIDASCAAAPSVSCADVISFCDFDIEALKKDGTLERGCDIQSVTDGSAALIITDEDIREGDAVSVFGRHIPVAGRLRYDPFSADGSTGGNTTLILSDEAFAAMTGISDYTMILVRLSDQAADADVDAISALVGDRYSLSDDRDNDTHGTYVAFLVCVYGFLVIIALVTILNIVNSISMSVSSRIKQYGAMRAVGMSTDQLARMIRSEALTYACLGCAAGILLGLFFSRWLYTSLVTSHYPYAHWHLPVVELMIIAAFFALSVIAGIRAPIRRLRAMSITETINQL